MPNIQVVNIYTRYTFQHGGTGGAVEVVTVHAMAERGMERGDNVAIAVVGAVG